MTLEARVKAAFGGGDALPGDRWHGRERTGTRAGTRARRAAALYLSAIAVLGSPELTEPEPGRGTRDTAAAQRRSGPSAWGPWLLVIGLAAIGGAIRVITARHTMFADELSTYWIITAKRAAAGAPALHGLGGVLSLVGHRYPGGDTAEISPPLYFALAWLTTQLGHAPLLVRAPSLIAGVAIIPLTYLLGLRLVGRTAALVAAALSALCPFLIYYSGEARAYSVLMCLLLISTLAMLRGIETGGRRWWALYAVASTAAMLDHYTAAFVLGGQLLWLFVVHPGARRAAILANVGAAVLFAPWVPAAIRELRSPTLKILSALSPFDWGYAKVSLEHWVIGFPYSNVSVQQLPGRPALVALGLALLGGVAAIVITRRRAGALTLSATDRRLWLVLVLALSAPVGEALESAVGTHVFGGRNLAASTIGVLLLIAALVVALPRRAAGATGALVIVAFGLGAAKMLEPRFQRPDLAAAATYVEHASRPGDVIIDETVAFSPGPLSPLDTVAHGPAPVYRAGNPAERDHPFGFLDPIVSLRTAVSHALAEHPGARVFLVRNDFPNANGALSTIGNSRIATGSATSGDAGATRPELPGYTRVAERYWTGFPGVRVSLFTAARR